MSESDRARAKAIVLDVFKSYTCGVLEMSRSDGEEYREAEAVVQESRSFLLGLLFSLIEQAAEIKVEEADIH